MDKKKTGKVGRPKKKKLVDESEYKGIIPTPIESDNSVEITIAEPNKFFHFTARFAVRRTNYRPSASRADSI